MKVFIHFCSHRVQVEIKMPTNRMSPALRWRSRGVLFRFQESSDAGRQGLQADKIAGNVSDPITPPNLRSLTHSRSKRCLPRIPG
uniref:AlNc14C1G62 protein n=1 Tax=Albugo laibachii Nc14 TaxID=890382 RepID=F0VYR0_9STRA|nr:AlNc14C1G62 [Albugo laibachii Nc14]|eukprot:CCA13924.1 AlNc14C1G62 [Albugo laibachii Nc14]